MENITVNTVTAGTEDNRTVTLLINPDKTVTLLGMLKHGTTIIVNQKLVDELQKLVDELNQQ